jgi:hypothetical protein
MMFWNKDNTVNPVKLRTASSVPVMAQRRTNAQTKHNPSQQTLTNMCSHRAAMLTRHETGNAQAHETRSDTCRHAHNRLPNERTADAVQIQIQHSEPGQVAHWIERACDGPTPNQHTNKTQPITTNAHKHVL